MAQTAPGNTTLANIKKLLLPVTLAKAGWAIVEAREDVQGVPYDVAAGKAELHRRLEDVAGVALSVQPFSDPELDAGPNLEVVARIGVGYDAVDVPALTRRKHPADDRRHRQFGQRRRGRHLSDDVAGAARRGDGRRWSRRAAGATATRNICRSICTARPCWSSASARSDRARRGGSPRWNATCWYTILISIPRRSAAPDTSRSAISTRRFARADFVTIHCPKTPETVGLFNAARLSRMKPSAYLVNTARGGIIDEKALHDALTRRKIAGAALDVFDQEPTPTDNPLLQLDNFICAPHMAGVTQEAVERMAIVTVQNMLSVLDAKPNRENVVNKEVLG